MEHRKLAYVSATALATALILGTHAMTAPAIDASASTNEITQVAENGIKLTADVDGVLVRASVNGWFDAPTNVAFEVIAPSGTVKWYQAKRQDDDAWNVSIDVGRDYSVWGTYRVNAWATVNGKTGVVASSKAIVDKPSVRQLTSSASGATASIVADEWSSDPSNVAFEIRSASGSTKWIQAHLQEGGAWTAEIDATTELDGWGDYTLSAWASYGSTTYQLSSTMMSVAKPSTELDASESMGTLSASADNWTGDPDNVAFEVVLPSGGSKWFQGIRQKDGAWTASIDVDSQLDLWGPVTVRAWATFSANTTSYGQRIISITDPAARGASITSAAHDTKLTAEIRNLPSPQNTTNAAAELIAPSGASTWIQAKRGNDGSWAADADVAELFGQWGTYRANLWITVSGRTLKAGFADATVSQPKLGSIAEQYDGTTGSTAITASEWSTNPQNVAFEVKSLSGKTKWYQAVEKNGSWSYNGTIGTDFHELGAYSVKVWATYGKSTLSYGSTTTDVAKPAPMTTATAEGISLILAASNWTVQPSNVAFAVTSASGSTKWYQGVRQQDGSWTCKASAGQDLGDWGTYTATTWATFGSTTSTWGDAQTTIKKASVSYGVRLTTGATAQGSDGNQASGWDGSAARGLSALHVAVSGPATGSVSYQVRTDAAGWSSTQSNGADATTPAVGTPFSAVKISLSGDISNYCDIWYRVYAKGYDWLGWTKNGEVAGSSSLNIEVQSIQVVVKPKGSAAPGSTSNADVIDPFSSLSTGRPKWIGARYYSQGRQGRDWDYLVIHISECTTLQQIDNTFWGSREASAHFGVGEGVIHQYVNLTDTAWAVGNWICNTRSVSIEHVGTTWSLPTRATLNTSAELMAALARMKGWTSLVVGENVGIHRWYSATACPANLDYHYLVAKANELLGNGFTYMERLDGPAWLESPSARGEQLTSLAATLSEHSGVMEAREVH